MDKSVLIAKFFEIKNLNGTTNTPILDINNRRDIFNNTGGTFKIHRSTKVSHSSALPRYQIRSCNVVSFFTRIWSRSRLSINLDHRDIMSLREYFMQLSLEHGAGSFELVSDNHRALPTFSVNGNRSRTSNFTSSPIPSPKNDACNQASHTKEVCCRGLSAMPLILSPRKF